MPEKIWRLPSSPASSSKRSSLSDPSTNSHCSTVPMRKSSLAKSSMETGVAGEGADAELDDAEPGDAGSVPLPLAGEGWGEGGAAAALTDCRDSFEASTIVSICLASIRVAIGA